tara:strand:+ start:3015 stop:4052 length:1038 start_codon:yes stop_codon:yes gene_type:complete
MSIADTDLVEVLRGGVSYKATGTQINDFLSPISSGYEVTNSIDFSKGTGSMNWGNNLYRDTYTPARGYTQEKQRNVVISFWIKPSPSTASKECILFTDNADNYDTNIFITNTGSIRFQMDRDDFRTNAGFIKLNEWNHVFIRWSNYGPTPSVNLSEVQRFERADIVINGVKLVLANMDTSTRTLPSLEIKGGDRSRLPLYLCLASEDDDESDKIKQTAFGGDKRAPSTDAMALKAKLAEFIILDLPDNFVNITVSYFPNMPTVNDFAEFNSAGKWIPLDPRESTNIKFKDADPAKSPVAYYLEFKDASKLWLSPETDFQLQNTATIDSAKGVTSAYQSTDTPTST